MTVVATTIDDGTQVYACCPPGCHERDNGPVSDNWHIWKDEWLVPQSRVWFTMNFIHAALWMKFPQWRVTDWTDPHMLVTYHGPRGHYVWRLTGVKGGPDDFWREAMWPD